MTHGGGTVPCSVTRLSIFLSIHGSIGPSGASHLVADLINISIPIPRHFRAWRHLLRLHKGSRYRSKADVANDLWVRVLKRQVLVVVDGRPPAMRRRRKWAHHPRRRSPLQRLSAVGVDHAPGHHDSVSRPTPTKTKKHVIPATKIKRSIGCTPV